MSTLRHTYALEAEAAGDFWQRMNVYLHLYLYDEQGAQTGMLSAGNREPEGTSSAGEGTPLRLESAATATRIKACLYVVPREMPASRQVADSPPLSLTLRVLRDGETIDTLPRRINPWGGDQLIGLEYE